MNKVSRLDVDYLLHRWFGPTGRDAITALSENDVYFTLVDRNEISVFGKAFLQAQWEIRDFEIAMDFTGNLDSPR